MPLTVQPLVTGPFQENTWVAGDTETGDAVICDPGCFDDREVDALAALLDELGLEPRAVVNTHGHIDHIAGVSRVTARWSIPFHLHPGDKEWIESVPQQCAMFGLPPLPAPKVDVWLEDGGFLELGSLRIEVAHVPGHTDGGVALLLPGHAIVGDTLFCGSIGRTDLPGGDFATLERSIRERLYVLEPSTIVHTGHGPDTTIERERRTNPFVRAA